MRGSASDIEVVQRGMSEFCFELAPVAPGFGLVEVGLKTEVEVEGDGREAFGLGAEQRALVPAREPGQGEGETGFAQAPTLVGGSGGDPVDEAIIETAVAVPIPGADGADGDILSIDDKETSLGYRTKIVKRFRERSSHSSASRIRSVHAGPSSGSSGRMAKPGGISACGISLRSGRIMWMGLPAVVARGFRSMSLKKGSVVF